MTRQGSFKRRIRARMAKTGERYSTARRVLIDQADATADDLAPRTRTWVAEPEMGDPILIERTGRGWEAWCDLIDAWPGHEDGHAAIAAWITDEHGIDAWWAQTITVGWERITGRRLPHQMPDGTFTAGRSRTVAVDAEQLRALLLDDEARTDLFPALPTELRSKPTSKNVRLALGPGVAEIALTPRTDGRTKVAVQHHKLPEFGDVDHWKAFWDEWLQALDEVGAADAS